MGNPNQPRVPKGSPDGGQFAGGSGGGGGNRVTRERMTNKLTFHQAGSGGGGLKPTFGQFRMKAYKAKAAHAKMPASMRSVGKSAVPRGQRKASIRDEIERFSRDMNASVKKQQDRDFRRYGPGYR